MRRAGPPRSSSKPALPARYYALLCDLLQQRGVDVARLLRSAGIGQATIHAPDAMLTLRQVEALVGNAATLTGRDDLGFELGSGIKLSTHDILGYGILSSPTLDAGLRLTARFYRLITPTFVFRYRRDAQQAEVDHQPILPMSIPTLRFHLETIAAAYHQSMVALLGRHLQRYDIHVSGTAPTHRRFRELAPARIHFDGEALPGVRAVMDAAMVDRPLAMADRRALAMAEARCEALLQHATETGSVSDWVAMMLRESREGMPTLTELARILCVGTHTLDRRLRREGYRFLDLSTRVRHERACVLLRQAGMSITETAYQLGYRDVANFTRAFRRSSGVSPSAYQRKQPAS